MKPKSSSMVILAGAAVLLLAALACNLPPGISGDGAGRASGLADRVWAYS